MRNVEAYGLDITHWAFRISAMARGGHRVTRLRVVRSVLRGMCAVLACAASILLATSILRGTAPSSQADADVAPSTREMAALLVERARAVDRNVLWFNVNRERAESMRLRLGERRSPVDSVRFRYGYASELAYAGRYLDALETLRLLQDDVEKVGHELGADGYVAVPLLEAVVHLRMGEEQNCAEGVNQDSCLLPIRGKGVHTRRAGSRAALDVLARVLRLDPGNLRARWLTNIAHMTLGTYPEGVPPQALIPPSVFAAEQQMPAFVNVASAVGLDLHGLSGGVVLEDLDGDGRLDLMVSAIGFDDQLQVFANDGSGRFVDRTAASGLQGETGGLNLIHADYDNDGLPDVLVLRGGWMSTEGQFPLSLLRNQGNFRFVDVTKQAGLLRLHPTQTATWLDFNVDGNLDLFIGDESSQGDLHPCELFRNNGDGTFTNVAREAGVDLLGYVKGVVSGDYDNDGRPDLYLSIAEAPNVLFHNDGPDAEGRWRFSNVSRHARVEEPRNSFPAAFFDYDNDGWLDIFVAPFQSSAEDVAADYLKLPTRADRGRLYRNRGDGTFEDVTRAAGLYRVTPGMGLNYGDLDNDGWLDLYIGTGNPDFATLVPNLMFRNDAGRRFLDVTTSGNFGHLQKGHGIAFGDIDNDGDQDVFEKMGGAYEADTAFSVLFENPGNSGRWVSLELEGTRANRAAIGARVKITAKTPRGLRTIHRTVGPGASFGSQTLRVHVGLGDASGVSRVDVRWPGSGAVQTFRGLAPNAHYRLRESSATPTPLVRPPVTLAREGLPRGHGHPSTPGRPGR